MAPGANAILVFDPEADANPSRTGTRRPALQSPAGGTVKQRERASERGPMNNLNPSGRTTVPTMGGNLRLISLAERAVHRIPAYVGRHGKTGGAE